MTVLGLHNKKQVNKETSKQRNKQTKKQERKKQGKKEGKKERDAKKERENPNFCQNISKYKNLSLFDPFLSVFGLKWEGRGGCGPRNSPAGLS